MVVAAAAAAAAAARGCSLVLLARDPELGSRSPPNMIGRKLSPPNMIMP